MLCKGSSDVIYKRSLDTDFDTGAFISEVRRILPSLNEFDTWIRSGIYIHKEFKDLISSYRLLGSYKPADSHARLETLLVKTQAGVSLADAEQPCVDFIRGHLSHGGADAAFVSLITSTGEGSRFFFIRSPQITGVTIPDDILDYMCTGAVKQYLRQRCGITGAALDGYLSFGYSLFDDGVIRLKAREIDKALRNLKFCDIASGSGQVVRAMADTVVRIRMGLNKYIGGADRTENNFLENFIINSLYATDCDAGALETLRAGLGLELSGRTVSDGHLIWGSILTEDLFGGTDFDIVVTNPPHMRQEQFSSIKENLKRYVSYGTASDLYCYYIERAFSCIREGGSVSIITSNRWMRADYGGRLRAFLAGQGITELVDYGSVDPIKGTVTPMSIITAAKEPPSPSLKVVTVGDMDYESLPLFAEENAVTFDRSRLGSDRWVFGSEDIGSLTEKIKKSGVPLWEYIGGALYRGLLTGLNEAFVVDGERAEALMKEDPGSRGILRPFLTGRDVKRYAAPKAKKYLIFIPKGHTDMARGEMEPWEWLSVSYPAVAAHLKKFEQRAAKRRDKGDYWWELRSCRYCDKFETQKIICPTIVRKISVTMDKTGIFSNDKTSIIATDDFYLLGLLNSRLMDFCFRRVSTGLLNGYYELRPADLASLPIMRISPSNSFQVKLYSRVELGAMRLTELYAVPQDVMADETRERIKETERDVNSAVYRLYKLTPKEISLIENN